MQRLTVLSGLAPANALEELADQAGGCYSLNTLVARLSTGDRVQIVTLVNSGSPGSEQTWTMLNGSESITSAVLVGNQLVTNFSTEEGEFSCPSAGSYVEHLLANAEWFGSSAPYYE